jgi:hypothetical protein
MKTSLTRGRILRVIVIIFLVASLPGAIRRLVETGDLYLFTRHFFSDILARLSGPGRLRFIVQPVVAVLLGARDGLKDARGGHAPFLWALVLHLEGWRKHLRSAIESTSELVCIAILLDLISQFLIFREIHPGAALVVGPVLIGLPYAVSRAIANRLWAGRGHRAAPAS